MKEIEGDYIQNPDGTWSKAKPGLIDKIIAWVKEIIGLIHD